ncbi:hypothetical protein HZA98_01745 [Candidatus Woesearchaeota archaeon]|nr:hypothetical protein [Candidatus Woesearchaeota archaeon]
MGIKREHLILFLTFLVAFGFRLLFLFRVPFYSSDEAYFNLRHSKYILQHFFPLIYDPQSYGGNIILNTHVFHYFLAFFNSTLPDVVVYKLLPALLASSIVFIVYLLAKELTQNEYASLFAALLSAFIPSFIGATINQISILSVFVPLFLLTLYFLLEIERKKMWFFASVIILVLLQPLNLLMLFTLLFFGILIFAESLTLKREEVDGMGLFVVFFLLVNLILYKQLYLKQGLATIWGNLPLELYGQIFQNFNLFETVASVGVIPLLLGVAGFILYKRKSRVMILLSAVLAADFSLLLLRIIAFRDGIIFLAIILCIVSAVSMAKIMEYLPLTKIAKKSKLIISIFIILTVTTLLIPSTTSALKVVHTGVTPAEIEALHWIKFNTAHDSVIAANAYEGNLIISIADRTNVIDTEFLRADSRILDVQTIFTTESVVKAKKALDNYGVQYVYFSDKTKALYDVRELKYASDENCFQEVFKNGFATIYKVVC